MNLFKRMIKPPCITEKCLKYPACRNKTTIHCTELSEYHYKLTDKFSRYRRWTTMKKYFPNLLGIRSNDGKPIPPQSRKIPG